MKKVLVLTLLLISAGLQAQWDKIYTHDEQIYAVDAVTPDTVYVAGLRCAIRSLDGGQTWEDLNYNFEDFITLDIDFPTLETGYLLGRGGVLKTEDYGETWKMVAPDSIEYLRASFVSADTGWIIGRSWLTHDGVVIRTYNGGDNWDYIFSGPGDMTDIQMINNLIGYVTTWDYIIKTIDGGNCWMQLTTNNIQGLPSCCSFINQDTGYVGAEGLYRTEDGGNEWTYITSEHAIGYFAVSNLQFLNYDTGYYAGYDLVGGILCTSQNAGNDWMRRMNQYIDVDMVNNNVGYTIEWTGEIYKTTEGGLHVDVEEQKVTDGKLLFPNPFSEEITLDVSALITANEEVIFTLFSVDGRKILHQKVNSYGEQRINTSHLKEGIYIYQISSGSEVIKNGKLIKL